MYKIFFLFLSLNFGNALGVIVGISCLENKNIPQKVVLLFDKHDMVKLLPEIKQQQQELSCFINVLSKKTEEVTFYIEFPYHTTLFKRTYDFSTIHVPIKDALAHAMKHGSIEYKPFDERTETDFWIREIILNLPAIIEAQKKGQALPETFKAVSISKYVETIGAQEKMAQELIKSLPAELKKTASEKLAGYKNVKNFIDQQIKIQNINPQSHFLNLAKQLPKTASIENNLLAIIQMQTILSDISLLHTLLNNKKPIIIVHAGAYHTHHLEKALMHIGFQKAFPDRNLTEGLNVEDLAHITWPTQLPSSFVQPIYEFLSLCSVCGKEATTKCSICKKAYYCSKECQKNAWPQHKPVCKL